MYAPYNQCELSSTINKISLDANAIPFIPGQLSGNLSELFGYITKSEPFYISQILLPNHIELTAINYTSLEIPCETNWTLLDNTQIKLINTIPIKPLPANMVKQLECLAAFDSKKHKKTYN